MGFFVHELRNPVHTAIIAFRAVQTGNVAVGGSTGAVLDRSLTSLQDLIGRSLHEVRLTAGIQKTERTPELLRPFEQRGADRTGVGIGLAFCRWGAEANRGRLYARNLPGKGCVFIVDLPGSPAVPVH
jgi:hypothetical protein